VSPSLPWAYLGLTLPVLPLPFALQSTHWPLAPFLKPSNARPEHASPLQTVLIRKPTSDSALAAPSNILFRPCVSRCVCLYAQGAVLDQVPVIARGNASNDDKIYELYHEIVMSNAEVDRLVRGSTTSAYLAQDIPLT